MNPQVSQRAAQAMQCQLFRTMEPAAKKKIADATIKADSWDALPEDARTQLEAGEDQRAAAALAGKDPGFNLDLYRQLRAS